MSYRFKAPRVRQRTGPMSDSPERPTKRLKVEQSKAAASVLTTELWDAPSEITDDFQVAVQLTNAHPWPTIASEGFVREEAVVNDHSHDTHEALIRRGSAGLLEEPIGWPAPWAGTLPSPFKDAVSPFSDCRPGTGKACFGMFKLRKFNLPPGGRLNGYVKVNRKRPRVNPASTASPHKPRALVTTQDLPAKSSISQDSGIMASSDMIHVGSCSQSPDWVDALTTNISPEVLLGAFNSDGYSMDNQVALQDGPSLTVESTWWQSSPHFASSSFGELPMQLSPPPQLSPFSGASTNTDDMGTKLLDFYVNNFLPGRSILKKTNLWQEFAQLIGVPSIMSAIQCYMGLYIFDYTQSGRLFQRINREFRRSEAYFSTLLAQASRSYKDDAEFVVLTIMLAMQDIILFERRRKLPEKPRWLEAYLFAEKIVELRVPSLSFRKAENVQLTALQNAHSVMVGRSLILAQTMDKLHLESFDVTKEGHRFQWLWFGNLNEIHGGCGFSKKLLHTIGRITWITAAVSDNPAFAVVGEHCLRMLESLEQVNSESDFLLAPHGSQPIEAIRERPQGYIIEKPEEMTAVTAEAWRLAAIAYLQCRMMRLPRNHPDVVATVDNLAHCIRIMPTSGIVFTAQAPLLPVFFLGILETTPNHKEICKHWMDMVMTIPVRSSVPPIATALKHLWEWTAQDPRLNPATSDPIPTDISLRDPWWEYLVERVQEDEQEILCLT